MKLLLLLIIYSAVTAKSVLGQSCNVQNLVVGDAHQPSDPYLKYVRFKYTCEPSADHVSISGLGNATLKGELTFLTRAANIVLTPTSKDGSSTNSTTIDLKGKDSIADYLPTLPKDSDFGGGVRVEQWSGGGTNFVNHVFKVLNRRFGPVLVVEREGQPLYISAYRPLTGLPNNVLGQTAVAVKFMSGESRMYIQSVCIESRSGSEEWRPVKAEEVKTAEQKYLDLVIGELKGSDQ